MRSPATRSYGSVRWAERKMIATSPPNASPKFVLGLDVKFDGGHLLRATGVYTRLLQTELS
jgi:deoxyinosine 3'endonuclease (endonuclease V)